MDPFSLQEVYRRINECLTMFHQSQSWSAVKVPAQEMVIIHKVVGQNGPQKEKEPRKEKEPQKEKEPLVIHEIANKKRQKEKLPVRVEVKLEQFHWSSALLNLCDFDADNRENGENVKAMQKDNPLPDDGAENGERSKKDKKGVRKGAKSRVGARLKTSRVKEERIEICPNRSVGCDNNSSNNFNDDSNDFPDELESNEETSLRELVLNE